MQETPSSSAFGALFFGAHRELLDVASVLGSVCDCAAWASAQIAEAIEADGRPLDEWTVAELVALVRSFDR
jgi:hypothetical protein